MLIINLGDLITDIILVALLIILLIVVLFTKLGELLSKRNETKMLPDDIKYYCENDIKTYTDICDYLERSENDANKG